MIKIRTIKLGAVCRDKATEREGTLTHWLLDMGQRIDYLFQPNGLNEETMQPLDKLALERERLEVSDTDFVDVEVPFEILGTDVTAKGSGFKGMAVQFVRHINGCFHIVIQPSGSLPRTNAPIKRAEFDLRECVGDMIPVLNEVQLEKSKNEAPSPTGNSFEEEDLNSGTLNSKY